LLSPRCFFLACSQTQTPQADAAPVCIATTMADVISITMESTPAVSVLSFAMDAAVRMLETIHLSQRGPMLRADAYPVRLTLKTHQRVRQRQQTACEGDDHVLASGSDRLRGCRPNIHWQWTSNGYLASGLGGDSFGEVPPTLTREELSTVCLMHRWITNCQLPFFDGRPTEEVLAAIAQERGVHLDLGQCASW
jgi:hypothetical protein